MNHDAKCLVIVITSHIVPSPTTNTSSFEIFLSCTSLLLASGLLGGLGDLTTGFLGLGHALDDTHSNSLSMFVSEDVMYQCTTPR
jgi:hypothetical protein